MISEGMWTGGEQTCESDTFDKREFFQEMVVKIVRQLSDCEWLLPSPPSRSPDDEAKNDEPMRFSPGILERPLTSEVILLARMYQAKRGVQWFCDSRRRAGE